MHNYQYHNPQNHLTQFTCNFVPFLKKALEFLVSLKEISFRKSCIMIREKMFPQSQQEFEICTKLKKKRIYLVSSKLKAITSRTRAQTYPLLYLLLAMLQRFSRCTPPVLKSVKMKLRPLMSLLRRRWVFFSAANARVTLELCDEYYSKLTS